MGNTIRTENRLYYLELPFMRELAMNPWSKDRVETFLGQEETPSLEFKSAKGFLGSEKDRKNFLDSLSCEVSAFLNSDGGTIIIGIDEAQRGSGNPEGRATSIEGCPRSIMNGVRLQSAICDRIHPGVSANVQVHTVKVSQETINETHDDKLVFVVEVRAGNTAYQAADKKYYARRGTEAEPMEDKDIRLRMLAADYPRIELVMHTDLQPREHGTWDAYEKKFQAAELSKQRRDASIAAGHPKLSGEEATVAFVEAIDKGALNFGAFAPHDITSGRLFLRIAIKNVGFTTIRGGCMTYTNPSSAHPEVTVCTRRAGRHEESLDICMTPVDFAAHFAHPLYPELEIEILTIEINFPRNLNATGFVTNFSMKFFVDGGLPVDCEINVQNRLEEAINLLSKQADEIKLIYANRV